MGKDILLEESYKLIMSVVNEGYAGEVIEAAKKPVVKVQ